MKTPKPQPITINVVCSLCGENWEAHGDDPTALDCIRLLKAKPPPHMWTYVGSAGSSTVAAVADALMAANTTATYTALSLVKPDDDDGCAPIGVPA